MYDGEQKIMGEVRERELFVNPYVVQMDRFADSLKHLSETFLRLEERRRTFTGDEIEEMFVRVSEKVCAGCEKKGVCLGEDRERTRKMVYEIMAAAEEYGAELNIELKRSLQKRCIFAPRFLRETLEVFQIEKQKMVWNKKMVRNREGCAASMNAFAEMVQHAARELDAGICMDEHLQKKVKVLLKRRGFKLLSSVFFMTKEGRYEVHLTLKAQKGECIAVKEAADVLTECLGRNMLAVRGERPYVTENYGTFVFMESASFYTLQGVAKIGKGCQKISGDTFSMTELPGGRQCVVLSDGMGAGEQAFRESAMVVEMLEELLQAGFPPETAIQMMNTALVAGREELRFSTVDLCVFDLYQGSCELLKAGASLTFIRTAEGVEKIGSTSLPVGVLQDLELEKQVRRLGDGDFIVMVTDGVLDALPPGRQEAMLAALIGGTPVNNPGELAHLLLEQVLELSGEEPVDDMTILTVGIWKT